VGAAMFAGPSAASAGGWCWPVDGPVRLAYGSPWIDATGRTCTHGGADIGASAGTRVRACTAGRVTFAGRVPAAGGGSTLAVTIATGEGLAYTCLPLSALSVTAGTEVASGDGLGALAPSGDGSTPDAHLHLSVRRGGAAIDPLSLLVAVTGPAAGAVPAPAYAPAAGGAPASSPDAPTGHGGVPVPAPITAAAPVPAPVPAPNVVRAQAPAPAAPLEAVTAAAPSIRVPACPPAPAGFARRIRPLPASTRLDLGAASAAARAWSLTAGGLAARALLAALAVLLVTPVLGRLRSATRASAGAGGATPAVAPVPRPHR